MSATILPSRGDCSLLRGVCIAVFTALVCGASPGFADAADITPQQLQFFETRIRPLLAENCHSCHGSKKQWAGLRLDNRASVLKGGESGPAIVPGKPEESLLIQAVKQDGDIVMPPEGELTERQIADLSEWIKQGAPFPADAVSVADNKGYRDPSHWAFQPRVDHPLPDVKDAGWVRTDLDRWILSRQEAAEIPHAEAADKRTLIRRVTYDLTGLPPTPEDVQKFLADDSDEAYSRLIDRLLASPAYGERWGRHWLDVVRYADSNGLDENVAHGNAWKYRDYVVDAFNGDLPYDQFVIQQLAGDLLPTQSKEERYQNLIATGFLSLGAKVIAEVDEVKMQMDIIDEQIDTVGKAFLGLTLACARCHDHKFDPITTANYYGLAGVLKSTRTMESFVKVARWYENPLPTPESEAAVAAHAAQVKEKQDAINAFMAAADQAVLDAMSPGETVPEKKEPLYPEATKAELKKLRDELKTVQQAIPETPSAMGVGELDVTDVAIHIRGSHLKLGDVVPRHTPEVFKGIDPAVFPADHSGRLEFARWLVSADQPLVPRVIVNRVWRWHFGAGLVTSTDNFGILGDRPVHPELLDWLATRFVENGWSFKWLHREILLSNTYRQSTIPQAAALDKDLENRLWSRFPVRRLEAEEVRDSLLAVSGLLDRTTGGPVLTVKNRGYLFDHTSKDLTKYDSHRRAIYLPVIRNNVYDLFQLLDFPDPATPNGDRNSTTVAPQALLMLNSDLIMESSDQLAQQLLADAAMDDASRIQELYRRVLSRDPSAGEQQIHLKFLNEVDTALTADHAEESERRRMAWSTLCQVVMASNEFLYLN